jgi:putative membrane protein
VTPTSERLIVPWPRPRTALALGLVTGALVVSPPTEAWVHASFTAHMTQHTLLIGVVAPLLALGSPAPGPARALGPGWLAAAVLLNTVLVLGWHAPPLFDAAEHVSILHAAEHLCLVAGSWALWWVAARAGGPAGWGPGALAVFVSLLPLTVLGVGLLFSSTTWYDHHEDLVDQQTGGVVMWAGGGALALVGALVLGIAWIGAGGLPSEDGQLSDPAGSAGSAEVDPASAVRESAEVDATSPASGSPPGS